MLSYAGYEVERSFDAVTKVSFATIRKNGKTLAEHRNGGFVLNIQGDESKQGALYRAAMTLWR